MSRGRCVRLDTENRYVTPLQGIRRHGGSVQVYTNLPLPLAAALDLEPGETVTWKLLDRTRLLAVRLPERKELEGEAAIHRDDKAQGEQLLTQISQNWRRALSSEEKLI